MEKSYAMEERIKEINPSAEIRIFNDFLSQDSIEKILDSKEVKKTDFFVEAIDSLSPKVKVIKILLEKKLPFISSMGAGGRINPLAVRTGTLEEVKNCGLARRIRKLLRREKVDIKPVKVVYSTEKGKKPQERTEWEEEDYKRGRIRGKQGSISFVPAVFGMAMAYTAFLHITENSFKNKNF